LQAIVKKCLEKHPERRYHSTEALRRELEDFVASKVRINYNGRLVIFLRHRNLISDSEAKTYVRDEELKSSLTFATDTGAIDARTVVLRPVFAVNLLLLLLLGGWTGVVDCVGDTVIFGSNQGNIFISNDRGHTYFGSFSGCQPSGTNAGVNAIAFKDATHGIVGHADDSGALQLYETSDGGHNWSPISYSGTCYDYDIAYCPGTDNTYISTGANQALPGASYSLDGGHNWIDYSDMSGTQMMACDFVDGMIGWAGAYATDESTGGMFMHVPSANPEPALTASLAGGKGSVGNTVIASIFFASLNTAMNMFHVDSYMQRVVIGIVLLIAFSLTGIRTFVAERLRLRRERTAAR